jgi:hypothetical protein
MLVGYLELPNTECLEIRDMLHYFVIISDNEFHIVTKNEQHINEMSDHYLRNEKLIHQLKAEMESDSSTFDRLNDVYLYNRKYGDKSYCFFETC